MFTKYDQTNDVLRSNILGLNIAKRLESVKVFSSRAPENFFENGHTMPKKLKRGRFSLVRSCMLRGFSSLSQLVQIGVCLCN